MSEKQKTDRNPGEILIDDVVIRDLASMAEKASKGGGAPGTRIGGQNIVTVEMPRDQVIQSFEPGKLHDERGIRYSSAMRGAPTNPQQHSSRFRISDLARGPLSVEAEEEQRIEGEVQSRLNQRVEEMRAQVTADAFREGFNTGKEQAAAQVLQAAEPRIAAFERLLASFENMKNEVFRANEEFLIHLVNQLAATVILRELKDDSGYTQRLAHQLLERLGTRENIKIYIGEAEVSSIETLKAGLAQNLGQLKNISIEVDPSITKGGCRVETEFGEVDARIDVQIQSIAQGLGTNQGS